MTYRLPPKVPEQPGTIVCKACGQRKPREAFSSKDGLRLGVNCTSCAKELKK